jgi:hypothetical protein
VEGELSEAEPLLRIREHLVVFVDQSTAVRAFFVLAFAAALSCREVFPK